MRGSTLAVAFAAACAALSGGCSSDPVACRSGGECASGRCSADGVCLPADDGSGPSGSSSAAAGGGGGSTSGSGAGGASSSSSGSPTSSSSGSGGSGACSPNHDGTITEPEVPLAAGLTVTHRAALDVSGIDTAGSDNGDGTRSWDYAAMLPGDQSLLIETLPLAGQWYESLYPNANYAARLGADSDLLGVFELTADAVLLVGVVSSADGFTRTELEYDPPVVTLDYPLSLGKTWQSSSTVSGLALGVVTVYSESYDFEVDQQGDLTTPFGTFPVLRLRSTLTRTFGVIDTVIRSHGFMTECFGLVASVRSQDNEPNVEFSNAAELRRIIP